MKRRVRIADIKPDPGYRQQTAEGIEARLAAGLEPTVLRDALARLYAATVEPFGTRPTSHSKEAEAELTAALADARKILDAPSPSFGGLAGDITVNERDGELYIIDGWTRLKALAELGVTEVDVEVEHLTREEEIRRYIDMNTTRRQL